MKKSPRNFHDVIERVINLIPETLENGILIKDLKEVQDSASYTAPEMMGIRWRDAAMILSGILPPYEELNEEWQRPLIDLWMDK